MRLDRIVACTGLRFARCVLAWAALAAALPLQAQRLTECKGLSWPYRATAIAVELTGIDDGDLGTDRIMVKTSIEGSSIVDVSAHFDDEEQLWVGRPRTPVKIGEVDLRPEVDGFLVTGPHQCRYRPVDEDCAAWFQFRAFPLAQLGVTVEPKTDALQLGFDLPVAELPAASCLPGNEAFRRLVAGSAEQRVHDALRSALQSEPSLAPFALKVLVDREEIVLSGIVASGQAKRLAESIARNHAEGREVRNLLEPTSLFDGVAVVEPQRLSLPVRWLANPAVAVELELPLSWDGLDGGLSFDRQQLQRALYRRSSAAPLADQPAFAQRVGLIVEKELDLLRTKAEERFLAEVESITVKRLPW